MEDQEELQAGASHCRLSRNFVHSIFPLPDTFDEVDK